MRVVAAETAEKAMRVVATYLLAANLLLVASALLAPQEGFVFSLGAGSRDVEVQSVDRSNKGDRLVVPVTTVVKQQQAPGQPSVERPKMIVGCDPVFSPLAVSAKLNYPGRCVA